MENDTRSAGWKIYWSQLLRYQTEKNRHLIRHKQKKINRKGRKGTRKGRKGRGNVPFVPV